MDKRQFHIFPFLLAFVLLISCIFTVPVSAADAQVNDIHIEDYISSKYYSGDDVIITYDLPLDPYSEIVTTDGNGTISTLCDGTYVNWTMSQTVDYIAAGSYYNTATLGSCKISGLSASYFGSEVISNQFGAYVCVPPLLARNLLCENYEYLPDIVPYMVYNGSYYPMDHYVTGTWPDSTYEFKAMFYMDFVLVVLDPSSVSECYIFATTARTATLSFGRYFAEDVYIYDYETFAANCTPLGYNDDENTILNVVNIDDFRTGAIFSVQFEYTCDIVLDGTMGDTASRFTVHYLTEDLSYAGTASNTFDVSSGSDSLTYTAQCELTVPEDGAYFYITFNTGQFDVTECSSLSWNFYNLQMTSTLSAFQDNSQTMERVVERLDQLESDIGDLNQGIQDTNDKLDDLNQGVQDTNDKLDDLISGGEAADDLIAGGDKLEDAGSGLGENIGEIQGFESIYMGQLENNLPDIVAGADLTLIAAPLSFVSDYLNKIVDGVPSQYMVVFTLPMLLGLFLYIVGHPVRAPRPDTSGDQVTRETFTETTILTGRHAGSTTTTRTVTTSQEIGRVHNE